MKDFVVRFIRLNWGLFLFSLGISLTLNAQIGYSPWDTFHAGVAKASGMTIGVASILVGSIIIGLTLALKEKVGLGSVLNMILIGILLDLILQSNLLPIAEHFLAGLLMLILGLFVMSFGSYYYIGSGFGAGPRDSLMVVLARKTRFPIGVCRGAIDLAALLFGWLLGGMVGVGTILSTFLLGYCIQVTFKLLKFDATQVEHEHLLETFEPPTTKVAGFLGSLFH